jgi:ActR/RegA family two-component response regulator
MAATVLLIDDKPEFLETMTMSFAANDIAIDVAKSWEEGLALFRVALHELVVADYNLPGSRMGLQLLLEVKRLRASTNLILISGAVNLAGGDLIEASGLVDRFIPKGADMAGELLREARAAEARVAGPTDWRAVGGAHTRKAGIDESALEAVDRALRTQIGS